MDNATITTVAERVALGVAWLDNVVPDWRVRVDPGSLDLDDPERCVLGQVFRDLYPRRGVDGYERAVALAVPTRMFDDGTVLRVYNQEGLSEQIAWATAHGFIDDGAGRSCDCDDCLDRGETSLTDQWLEELTLTGV
jgi:hypothetical protein